MILLCGSRTAHAATIQERAREAGFDANKTEASAPTGAAGEDDYLPPIIGSCISQHGPLLLRRASRKHLAFQSPRLLA